MQNYVAIRWCLCEINIKQKGRSLSVQRVFIFRGSYFRDPLRRAPQIQREYLHQSPPAYQRQPKLQDSRSLIRNNPTNV